MFAKQFVEQSKTMFTNAVKLCDKLSTQIFRKNAFICHLWNALNNICLFFMSFFIYDIKQTFCVSSLVNWNFVDILISY